MEPTATVEGQPTANQNDTKKQTDNKSNYVTAITVLAIIATISLIFCIYFAIKFYGQTALIKSYESRTAQLEKRIAEESKDDSIVEKEQEETSESETTEKDEDIENPEEKSKSNYYYEPETDSTIETKQYIYVAQWGMKIKIPDEISGYVLSYTYDSSSTAGCQILSVTGFTYSQVLPEFANLRKNPNGIASIYRCSKNSTMASDDPIAMREFVFTDDNGYYYFAPHPQSVYTVITDDFSKQVQELEVKSTKILHDAFLNKENYSKI